MCGILVSVEAGYTVAQEYDDIAPWIAARGPDSLQSEKVLVCQEEPVGFLTVSFTSSVLHLRGHEVTVQPLVSDTGDVLCWNGEVWRGLDIKDDENDGTKLLEALWCKTEVWKVMERIEGPWAMVYFSARENKLWYGRDCLGRRSLLRKRTSSGGILFSSVGIDMEGWEEIEVDGLWCLDLNDWQPSQEVV
jgi:asparagine synthetase B (glutamine-hydrolysing)